MTAVISPFAVLLELLGSRTTPTPAAYTGTCPSQAVIAALIKSARRHHKNTKTGGKTNCGRTFLSRPCEYFSIASLRKITPLGADIILLSDQGKPLLYLL